MDIGIGVPNTLPDVTGALLLGWMREADQAGFSTLASIGRVGFPGYEELSVFAAGAGVTKRIGFLTNILIGPVRSSAELAKQAVTVDQLSGGRLTLGLAVGSRPDDYALTGREFSTRGQQFDAQLHELRSAWRQEPLPGCDRPVCPTPVRPEGIPIMIGGRSPAAMRRIVEHGAGWVCGGGRGTPSPDAIWRLRSMWKEAGRQGAPRIVALAYYGFGPTAPDRSRAYLEGYYSQMGPATAAGVADSCLLSPQAVREIAPTFEALGVDELVILPTVADIAQVEALASAVM